MQCSSHLPVIPGHLFSFPGYSDQESFYIICKNTFSGNLLIFSVLSFLSLLIGEAITSATCNICPNLSIFVVDYSKIAVIIFQIAKYTDMIFHSRFLLVTSHAQTLFCSALRRIGPYNMVATHKLTNSQRVNSH